VSDLRRFEVSASLIMAALLLLVSALLLVGGKEPLLGGLVAGCLLGLANFRWMIGTARRFLGHAPTARSMKLTASIRFLTVAVLFGGLLIIGRVDPVGAVLGYGCFPIAAAVAGWRILRPPAGATG
jgi:hypothetical protein